MVPKPQQKKKKKGTFKRKFPIEEEKGAFPREEEAASDPVARE